MEVSCVRDTFTDLSTTSRLYVDGTFECFVLEDRYREPGAPKVPGATCIPNGRYEVKDTWSPKFQRNVLEITGVPNFRGIRIHSGNDRDDTEGCPLPGRLRAVDKVIDSRIATDALNAKIRAALAQGRRVFWTASTPGRP